jgi:hypothetical protein
MNLDPNDVQTEALIHELGSIIQNDRYPLSPRILALKEILSKMRPEPEREPAPTTALRAAEQGTVQQTTVVAVHYQR